MEPELKLILCIYGMAFLTLLLLGVSSLRCF